MYVYAHVNARVCSFVTAFEFSCNFFLPFAYFYSIALYIVVIWHFGVAIRACCMFVTCCNCGKFATTLRFAVFNNYTFFNVTNNIVSVLANL